jgi:hypothetical protein
VRRLDHHGGSAWELVSVLPVLFGIPLSLAEGGDASEGVLIAGAIWDVVARTLATTLGVFKPGRRRP